MSTKNGTLGLREMVIDAFRGTGGGDIYQIRDYITRYYHQTPRVQAIAVSLNNTKERNPDSLRLESEETPPPMTETPPPMTETPPPMSETPTPVEAIPPEPEKVSEDYYPTLMEVSLIRNIVRTIGGLDRLKTVIAVLEELQV